VIAQDNSAGASGEWLRHVQTLNRRSAKSTRPGQKLDRAPLARRSTAGATSRRGRRMTNGEGMPIRLDSFFLA